VASLVARSGAANSDYPGKYIPYQQRGFQDCHPIKKYTAAVIEKAKQGKYPFTFIA